MGLIQWVKDKLDGDEPKPALTKDTSAYRSQVPQAAQKPLPAPKGQPAQNSAAFNARLAELRANPPQPSAAKAKEMAMLQQTGAAGFGYDTGKQQRQFQEEMQNEAAKGKAGVGDPSKGWGAVGVWAPMEPPPDSVRQALNSANWQVPAAAEDKGKMPDTSFEAFTDLAPHKYRVSNEEMDRIQKLYHSARADASGFKPPPTVAQNMPLMEFDQVESAELTWDAYNELGSEQKAAVDFNTLLVDAREKDLNRSTYLSDADRMQYDDQVTKLFGEGRGSDVLATETVKLLSGLDMNLVGQDLDEYLSLDRAIDTTELPDFKFSKEQIKTLNQKVAGGGEVTYDQVRTPANIGAVDTVAIQNAQNLIKTALASPEALTFDLNTVMNGPTADMQLGEMPLGFGTETSKWKSPENGQLDSFFKTGQQVLTGAINPEGAPAEPADRMAWLMEDMPSWPGYSEAAPAQFMDFLSRQAQLLGQYGSPEAKTTAAMLNSAMGKGE